MWGFANMLITAVQSARAQGETRVTQSPDPARTHLLDMASLTRERLFYNSLLSARSLAS